MSVNSYRLVNSARISIPFVVDDERDVYDLSHCPNHTNPDHRPLIATADPCPTQICRVLLPDKVDNSSLSTTRSVHRPEFSHICVSRALLLCRRSFDVLC